MSNQGGGRSGEGDGVKPPLARPSTSLRAGMVTDPRQTAPSISGSGEAAEGGVFKGESSPPQPRPSAPEPQRQWRDKNALSVMKAMPEPPRPQPPPVAPPPMAPTPRAPAPSPSPSPMAPSPMASGPMASPMAPSPVAAKANWMQAPPKAAAFVPDWEVSASAKAGKFVPQAEEAPAREARPERPTKPEPPKKVNPALQSVRTSQLLGRRVVIVVGALAALGVAGVLIATGTGASERANGPPVDPAIEARQKELIAKGRAERSPLAAIVLFDQAITLAPRAPGTRDALLQRANRFLDVDQLDAASADINLLRQRGDIGSLQSELDKVTARLKKKRP